MTDSNFKYDKFKYDLPMKRTPSRIKFHNLIGSCFGFNWAQLGPLVDGRISHRGLVKVRVTWSYTISYQKIRTWKKEIRWASFHTLFSLRIYAFLFFLVNIHFKAKTNYIISKACLKTRAKENNTTSLAKDNTTISPPKQQTLAPQLFLKDTK